MKTQTIIALKFLLAMTILTGIIYPLIMTGLAQLSYPAKANGSIILKDGKIIGSGLIGQKFDSSIYFWPRPSAIDYYPVPSSSSNLGPISKKLKMQVEERSVLFATEHSISDLTSIPKEMIFASGSGLDPHISPLAAMLQLERVTAERKMNTKEKEDLVQLIKRLSEKPQFSLFGEPRINVFKLNLALDNINP